MQVYESSLKAEKRPCPSTDCTICSGKQRLHKHGTYRRYRGSDGARQQQVQRYVCPRCRHTWSIIPTGMMPYRSLEIERFEVLSDSHFGLTNSETPSETASPQPTEKEAGCARRAWKALRKRIPLLCGFYGQLMPVLAPGNASGFWRSLRQLGSTSDALRALARDFKTSLLGCYCSLRPFWERGFLPVPDG